MAASPPHAAAGGEPRLTPFARAFAGVARRPWWCVAVVVALSALALSGYRDPGWAEGYWEGTWWRGGDDEAQVAGEPGRSQAAGEPGRSPTGGPARGPLAEAAQRREGFGRGGGGGPRGRGGRGGRGSAIGRGDSIVVVRCPAVFTREGAEALRDVVARIEALDAVEGVTWLDNAPPLNIFGLAEPILPKGAASPNRFEVARERAVSHPLVVGQLLSPDAETVLLLVAYDWVMVRDEADVTDAVLAAAREAAADHPQVPLDFALTGPVPLRLEWVRNRDANERLFQFLAYGLILALSAVLFRGLSVVAVTAAAPALGVFWTLGVIRAVGLDDNPFSHVILPVLLSLVGFADSVHMMVDIRRGLAAGLAPHEASRRALATVGVACFLTMITTAIGMASLSLARHEVVRDFGWSCVIGVFLTWIAVLAVLPTACATPWGHVLARGAGREVIGGQLPRVARGIDFTLRHARITSALAIGLLGALGLVSMRLEPDDRKANILPPGSPAQKALDHLDAALGGLDVCSVDIRWTGEPEPEEVADVVTAIDGALRAEPLLGHPLSIVRLIEALPGEGPARERMDLLELLPPPLKTSLYDPAAQSGRVTFRVPDRGTVACKPTFERVDEALRGIEGAHPAFTLSLSGEPIFRWRDLYQVVTDLARSLGTAAVEILVVMVVAFRSLRLGLVAIVPNMLPLAASAAYMVFTGQSLDIVTVCALTICLGIAVDDTIHFLSRYRFELDQGLERQEAIRQAFAEVGTGMIMTTLVLVAGFSSVFMSDSRDHRSFASLGVVTLSIALVCDILFLPALVAVFDRVPRRPAPAGTGPTAVPGAAPVATAGVTTGALPGA
ncbi:MAG: efflux RND transporter permease subunit [Planctomycetaceae bacterium]